MQYLSDSLFFWSSEFLEMATNATPGLQIAAVKQCASASPCLSKLSNVSFGFESKSRSCIELRSSSYVSPTKLSQSFKSVSVKYERMVPKAMSGASDKAPASGLPIDLRGRTKVYLNFFTVFWSPDDRLFIVFSHNHR